MAGRGARRRRRAVLVLGGSAQLALVLRGAALPAWGRCAAAAHRSAAVAAVAAARAAAAGRAAEAPAPAGALCADGVVCASSPQHGWGVFAARAFGAGDVVHQALGRLAEGRGGRIGDADVFPACEVSGVGREANASVVGLGFSSLHNRDEDPNVDFCWERLAQDPSCLLGTFAARRAVREGEELLLPRGRGGAAGGSPAPRLPRSFGAPAEGQKTRFVQPPSHTLASSGLFCAPSAVHGWGVFAGRDFAHGETIHESPGRLIPGGQKSLEDDVFQSDDLLDEADCKRWSILGLGYATLHNHCEDPNTSFCWGQPMLYGCRLVGRFYTTRRVAAGEELFISYGDKWFSSRGLTAK